jgi:DeoR/GlpR family transcriptional regulator of sugar metabolism
LSAEGTFESSIANFRIKQIICERCAQVTLLADHTKFGKRALCKVLDISQIHRVITDDKTSEEDIAALRGTGKTIKVATLEVPAHVA